MDREEEAEEGLLLVVTGPASFMSLPFMRWRMLGRRISYVEVLLVHTNIYKTDQAAAVERSSCRRHK